MAISEAFVNTGTSISTTEYSLTNASTTIATQTTAGAYQALIDLNNMTASETYVIRLREKVYSAGTQRVVGSWTLTGVQSDPIWISPCVVLLNGWDFTVQKSAGTDRSLSWSVRKIA